MTLTPSRPPTPRPPTAPTASCPNAPGPCRGGAKGPPESPIYPSTLPPIHLPALSSSAPNKPNLPTPKDTVKTCLVVAYIELSPYPGRNKQTQSNPISPPTLASSDSVGLDAALAAGRVDGVEKAKMAHAPNQQEERIMSMDRRTFLTRSLAAGAALSFPAVATAQRDKTYRTALIGSGWWGTNILREAVACGRCKPVALVDVDRQQLATCAAEVAKWTSDVPKHYEDYREMIAREKPDIAIVATPDHWHPLCMIEAVRSGAHVYVEKPIGHTIMEGRAMVNAARAANRVVQVGTHRRVSPHNVSGMKFLRAGNAGKIGMVRSFVLYGGGGPERPKKNIEPPKELNWDFWCGPGPLRSYCGDPDNPRRGGIHPRSWRSWLDYANGTLADWGIHWLDQVLWIMERKWPKTVHCTGGRPILGEPILTDEVQTTDAPDHQVASYQFEDFTATWEHRRFGGNPTEKTENVGCWFYGTKGTFHMGWRRGWTFYPSGRGQQEIHEDPQLNQPDSQNIKELWADFLKAIETGERPACDIETIHYSTNMSLLGMLSYKLGRSVTWDGQKETCLGDPQANALLRRDYRGPWTYPGA